MGPTPTNIRRAKQAATLRVMVLRLPRRFAPRNDFFVLTAADVSCLMIPEAGVALSSVRRPLAETKISRECAKSYTEKDSRVDDTVRIEKKQDCAPCCFLKAKQNAGASE